MTTITTAVPLPAELPAAAGPRRPSRLRVREAARRERIDRLVSGVIAATGLVLVGLRLELLDGVSFGLLFAIAMAPLWFRSLWASAGLRALLLAAAVALVAGVVLSALNPYGHSYSPANALAQLAAGASIPVLAGFVLWARRVLPAWSVTFLFGAGLLLGIDPGSPLFGENPWKFGFSMPVTLVVLGLVQLQRSRALELVTVVVFAFILFGSDARSALAILLVTAALLGWQLRPNPTGKRRSALLFTLFAAVLATSVYFVVQQLILAGFLGAETQARSIAQLRAGGSLLFGGRPEAGATAALLRWHPLGFGPGALPIIQDVRRAQSGMAALGYNPDNGYVYNYLFGGHVELHSVAADLWASFGLGGFVLLAVIGLLLVSGIAKGTVTGTANATAVYLGVLSVWNLGFSPIGTSLVPLAVALGLLAKDQGPVVRRAVRGRIRRRRARTRVAVP